MKRAVRPLFPAAQHLGDLAADRHHLRELISGVDLSEGDSTLLTGVEALRTKGLHVGGLV